MAPASDRRDDLGDFAARYSPLRSETARKVERIALGQDVGLQGYTTLEQAEILGEFLQLDSSSCLLDLGAGRGWPGVHLARAAGCRLLSTDVPWDALRQAQARTANWDPPGSCHVVAADGRALPFRSAMVAAISHSDVFC